MRNETRLLRFFLPGWLYQRIWRRTILVKVSSLFVYLFIFFFEINGKKALFAVKSSIKEENKFLKFLISLNPIRYRWPIKRLISLAWTDSSRRSNSWIVLFFRTGNIRRLNQSRFFQTDNMSRSNSCIFSSNGWLFVSNGWPFSSNW